jgi:hypothetical protein
MAPSLVFLGAFIKKNAKNDYQFRHECLSVRLRGTTRLSLNGISWNLIY